MGLKENLFALSGADNIGTVTEASKIAYNLLSHHCECEKTDTLTVFGFLKGESNYTLMLDAHIDQIGFIVTDVDDNGFLTVSNAGGIDLRALPSGRVQIHGKEKILGVFCATPPHLSGERNEFDDIKKIKIDSLLGENAKNIIAVGDYVTFCGEPSCLLDSTVCGKSFDNRASVACVIEIAERLKNKKLPFNVAFVLSDSEELGLRGVRPAAFKVNPDEALVLDVTFGDGIGISDEECGKLGLGGMIGVSPCLDNAISQKLISVAKEGNLPYQLEIMSEKSGTNADMVSISREGVKTCTLSIPLRNMHTAQEIVDLNDLNAVCDLVCEYILKGGAMCD